jgi:hypothetical protein
VRRKHVVPNHVHHPFTDTSNTSESFNRLRRAHDHAARVVRRQSNMLHATGGKHRFESGFCYDSGSLIHGPRCKRRIQANLENCKFRHLARLVIPTGPADHLAFELAMSYARRPADGPASSHWKFASKIREIGRASFSLVGRILNSTLRTDLLFD